MEKVKTRITSQIASCLDCDKEWQDYTTARKSAYNHARKTGHHVSVEITKAYHYNFKS